MAPKPPNARHAPAQPGRSSKYADLPTGPQTPQRSSRPGEAGAVLEIRGPPDRPPNPPTLVTPRRSRDAPRNTRAPLTASHRGRQAGVDHERLARDPARFVAREIDRAPADVPARALGAERAR